jgi:drug/metabolite transporter (DMT)-like permease
MAMFFTALPMVPLFDITILFFACPLTMIWLAAWLLKETPTRTQVVATFIGFAGVLAAMWPQLLARLSATAPVSLSGTMLALGAAVLTAFAMLSLRKIAQTETPASIIFVFLVTVSILSVLTTGITWVWPGWSVILVLFVAGILGGVGQITMTYAYRTGPISLLSVIEYTAIIFAALFGYMLFAEIPGWPALVGAVLVSMAGIMVATARPAQAPTSTP